MGLGGGRGGNRMGGLRDCLFAASSSFSLCIACCTSSLILCNSVLFEGLLPRFIVVFTRGLVLGGSFQELLPRFFCTVTRDRFWELLLRFIVDCMRGTCLLCVVFDSFIHSCVTHLPTPLATPSTAIHPSVPILHNNSAISVLFYTIELQTRAGDKATWKTVLTFSPCGDSYGPYGSFGDSYDPFLSFRLVVAFRLWRRRSRVRLYNGYPYYFVFFSP